MSIADELQKLSDLQTRGSLTNEEFVQAKARLLAAPTVTTSTEVGTLLSDQLNVVRNQNELARIDREWELERQQYEIRGRYGFRFIPTIGTGIAEVVIGGLAGAFWIGFCLVAMNAYDRIGYRTSFAGGHSGTYSAIELALLVFGSVFILLSVGRGLFFCVTAINYDHALHAYQERHDRAAKAVAAS